MTDLAVRYGDVCGFCVVEMPAQRQECGLCVCSYLHG